MSISSPILLIITAYINQKKRSEKTAFLHYFMAPGPGFEPGLEDSKSSVLPLDDPGMNLNYK